MPESTTSPRPLFDGSTNIFRNAAARFQLSVEEGDFPQPLALGTFQHGAVTNKIQFNTYCKPRWSPDGRGFLFLNQRVFVYCERDGGLELVWERGSDMDPEARRILRSPADAEFSGDGEHVFIAFGGEGEERADDRAPNCVVQVDARTGAEQARVPMPFSPTRLSVHPDGRRVAVVGNSNGAYLVDLGGNKTLLAKEGGSDIAVSPDGKAVAIALADKGSRVVDLAGKVRWQSEDGSTLVAWLPDGRVVFNGVGIVDLGDGSVVKIAANIVNRTRHLYASSAGFGVTVSGKWTAWNLKGECVRTLKVPSAADGVTLGAMAPDGRVLVGWDSKNSASLYALVPRFAVSTLDAKNATDEGRAKQETFASREAAEKAASKIIAGVEKKGYALAEVIPGTSREQQEHDARWAGIRKSKAAKYLRPAWRPRTEERASPLAGFRTSAKLPAGEAWPQCTNCHDPLELMVQIDLAAVPEATRTGLLQVFYCTNNEPHCEVDTEAFLPGAGKSKLVRVIDATTATAVVPRPALLAKRVEASPLEIVGWEPLQDGPSGDELEEVYRKSLAQLGVEDLWEGLPQPGDKLGGYPSWAQGVEYPKCADCKKRMDTQLLQLASNAAAGWQWGDLGTAYVVSCAKHPARVELIWQAG